MTGSNLIQVQQLSKSFGSLEVFKNLKADVAAGEFVTLLGSSGCGKSTLLKIIGGLEAPSSGEVSVSSSKFSFVFQEPRLLPWRNCLENILLPTEFRKQKKDETLTDKALGLIETLHLQTAKNLFPHQLSGGMKMRTAIARSLILDPQILLMDEPFSALDEKIRWELQQELHQLYQKNHWTLIFVTHQLEEALFLSDRILIFGKQGSGLVEFKPQLSGPKDLTLRNSEAFFSELRRLRLLISSLGSAQ